jgi:hypothetical protein
LLLVVVGCGCCWLLSVVFFVNIFKFLCFEKKLNFHSESKQQYRLQQGNLLSCCLTLEGVPAINRGNLDHIRLTSHPYCQPARRNRPQERFEISSLKAYTVTLGYLGACATNLITQSGHRCVSLMFV